VTDCPSLVWFRNDLRLGDNPALQAAIQRGAAILPVFVYAPEEEAPWSPGAASRWWLHQSLAALEASLRAVNSRLIIRQGAALDSLRELINETGAGAVFWNRRVEPAVIGRDAKLKEALLDQGLEVKSFNAALLHKPWAIQNRSGEPFRVFTPFWKNCLAQGEPAEPLIAPKKLGAPKVWPHSLPLDALALEPQQNWVQRFKAAWQPGEAGAASQLRTFLGAAFTNYAIDRNRPDLNGTSRLSPHFHFGEISPHQIWHALKAHAESASISNWRTSQFVTEIGWREFAHYLLFHFRQTPTEPLRVSFKNFRWRNDAAFLEAWQKGKTGYPIVDAGMRELWATGWMHNRVRMIVASFLVKDLLLSWREGAAWFWDTLVDADLAQNTLGWQWIAGCGADASPYFRVFNPIGQGQKFDPNGDYVRRWCPELAKLPDQWLHRPGETPAEILYRSGVRLGQDYPEPIVSHVIAREVALEAFGRLKSSPN
jgi:deoxyribodipyrimidine photo-lyase